MAQETANKVLITPPPDSEKLNGMYEISVNGQPLECYRARGQNFTGGDYFFAKFDFEGEVEIKLNCVCWNSLEKAKIFTYPKSVKATISDTHSTIKINAKRSPFTAIIAPFGDRVLPLIIFGNKIEKDKPSPKDAGVIYLKKGVHIKEQVKLASGQTLYLEDGAILKGSIYAEGNDISILGRGIISAELKTRWSRGYFLHFVECKNLRISGITVKESPCWTFLLQNCNGVSIRDVKILNSRGINDDAIDICNSSNVNIKNVFARAQDDIIAVKGIKRDNREENLPCENIFIKDCVFWTDRANIFRIGYDSASSIMKNINVKNIDVPFYATDCVGIESAVAKGIITIQAGNSMPIEDLTFENIRIHSDGSPQNVFIAQTLSQNYEKTTTPGSITNCTVKNLIVSGETGTFKGGIQLDASAVGGKIDKINFYRFTYFGKQIGEDFEHYLNQEASNVSFKTRRKSN